MASATITISLDVKRHRHILDWYTEQENASLAVRQVLDAHVRGQVQLVDVYRELRTLQEQVASLRAHGGYVEVEGEGSEATGNVTESAEVALALDKLGVD